MTDLYDIKNKLIWVKIVEEARAIEKPLKKI